MGLQKTGNNHSDFLTKFAESQAEKIAQQPGAAPAQAAPGQGGQGGQQVEAKFTAMEEADRLLSEVDFDGSLTQLIQMLRMQGRNGPANQQQQQGGQQAAQQGLGAGYQEAFGPGMVPDGRGQTM